MINAATTTPKETAAETALRLEAEARQARQRAEAEAAEVAHRAYVESEAARRAAEQQQEASRAKAIALLQDELGDPARAKRTTELLARVRAALTYLRGAPGLDTTAAATALDTWRRELEAEVDLESTRWRALAHGLAAQAEHERRAAVRDLPTDIESAEDLLLVGAGNNARGELDGWRYRPGSVVPASHPVRDRLLSLVASMAATSASNPIATSYGVWLIPARSTLAEAAAACPLSRLELARLAPPRLAWKWLDDFAGGYRPGDLPSEGDGDVMRALQNTLRLHERQSGVTPSDIAEFWSTKEVAA